MDREYLAEVHPEVIMLAPSTLDAAILGLTEIDGQPRLVYSRTRLILQLQEDNGWDYESAVEWYDFNIAGAHFGPNTPVYLELEWGD